MLIGVLGCSADAAAATIALHQDAVSAAVLRRVFASDGKRMLSGSLASCTYVYVEQPAVSAQAGPRNPARPALFRSIKDGGGEAVGNFIRLRALGSGLVSRVTISK